MRNHQNKLDESKTVAARKGNEGFSMMELIISMVVFMVVMGAMYSVMNLSLLSRGVVNRQVPLSKSVRFGLNLIGRDTYNAGYGYPLRNTVVLPDNRISVLLGIPNDFDNTRDTVPPIIAGNNITLNTFNTAANIRTDQVTFLFKDNTFNVLAGTDLSQPLNINAATPGVGFSQIIPLSGSNASCRANDLFLITGGTGSTLGVATSLVGTDRVRFANGDLLGFNLAGSADSIDGITTPASMHRVNMITYFVTATGTLTRREYVNVTPAASFVDEPLIYGVEDFQIQYVMEDGTVSDNPSAGVDGIPGTADDVQTNLAAVRQIRYTISVRSTEVDQKGQPNRVSMSSTFSTRNLGYDAN